MAKVYPNRAWMATATTGTGTITLGAAQAGYLTFAEAGVSNADTASYVIIDGDDFEVGIGTYTSSGTTFSRDTVTVSKISGTAGTSKLNLSGTATIFLTARGNDIYASGGTDVALADGGTGASLADPGGDRLMFWDDSAGFVDWLTAGSGLAISSTTITASAVQHLGTLTTTSGASQSLTSLDLTNYKLILFLFRLVSDSSTGDIMLGTSTSDDVIFIASSSSDELDGIGVLDLSDGMAYVVAGESGAADAFESVDTTITTASTSISFATTAGTFDSGSIRVFGIR